MKELERQSESLSQAKKDAKAAASALEDAEDKAEVAKKEKEKVLREKDGLAAEISDMDRKVADWAGRVKTAEQLKADIEQQVAQTYEQRFTAQAVKEQALVERVKGLQAQIDDLSAKHVEAQKAQEKLAEESRQAARENQQAMLAKEAQVVEKAREAKKAPAKEAKPARRSDGEWEKHYNVGLKLWEDGDLDGAIREFKRGLESGEAPEKAGEDTGETNEDGK